MAIPSRLKRAAKVISPRIPARIIRTFSSRLKPPTGELFGAAYDLSGVGVRLIKVGVDVDHIGSFSLETLYRS